VVTTQDGDTVFVTDLERNQQRHGLDRVVTSIDVVTHEEVVGIGWVATDTKELLKIMELTMHIATHCHWTLDWLDVGFVDQDRSALWHHKVTQQWPRWSATTRANVVRRSSRLVSQPSSLIHPISLEQQQQ
jgi:hypothetical protein